MNEPIKPEFPTEPNKYLELTSLGVSVEEKFEIKNSEKLIKDELDFFYKPYTLEGKFELEKISLENRFNNYSYILLTFIGAKIIYENKSYERELRQYKKDVIDYPRKVEKYNEKLKKYNEWLAGAKDRELEKLKKEKVRLEKQKERVEKELRRYETY